MTLRPVVAAAAFVAGLVSGCSHPTRPTGTPDPATASPVNLTITAPNAIAPGQTVSFVATASLSDGTTQDDTGKVVWSAFPASVLSITRDTGVATALAAGDVTIAATFGMGGPGRQAQVTRTVVPPNTYRLTGTVLESRLPVQGATVGVVSGIGAGLSTLTDYDGSYRLYGVAGVVQVKVTKPGYDDLVKPFTATQDDVLDFPEVHQTAAMPSLAGTYTLTLTADPGCPTTPTGVAALPDGFRQQRSYVVSMTQDGPALTMTLSGAAIMPRENQFTGRVEPDAIAFDIGFGSYGNGLGDGVAEQVSSTQWFVFGGQGHAQRSSSAMTGHLDGALEVYTPSSPTTYTLAAQCVASNNSMTLTPIAQPARRR
jgi:hypothetical protein